MKCRACEHARRFSAEAFFCVQYGMIIRDTHKCSLPGAREKEDPPVLTPPAEQIGGPQDEP